MPGAFRFWLLLAVALPACGGKGDGDRDCGTAAGTLPDGLVTISWDDGDEAGGVRGQGWGISVGNRDFDLDDEPLHEGVRFDIDRPARIHGFSVRWTNLADAREELEAGLYADLGHNGYNYWLADPLWTGTRCQRDADDGESIDYVLEEPIEIAHPGLVFVAHAAESPEDATFAFDDGVDGEGDCLLFDECHSALQLTDALENTYFQGVSFSLPFDFLVSLHLEYTDEVLPQDRLFQPVSGVYFGPTMAFGDYDDDGWDDVVTHGPDLWRNQGDGTFIATTASSGIAAMGIQGTGSWGDYDNDGCLDLFVASDYLTEPNSLLHSNCDGTFSDVTEAAGVSGLLSSDVCGDPTALYPQSQAGAWIDLDLDGRLDLYVANYNCGFDLPDFVDNVYRNNGDGTFADWTGTRGFLPTATASRGAAPIDVDFDGDLDLLVHNYVLQANLFFRNDGGGTFTEIASDSGLEGEPTEFQGDWYWGHTLGTAWGDLDGDGDFDLVEANLAHPRFYHFSDKTRVLRNDAGAFTDLAGDWSYPESGAGLRYQETHTVPTLADFDQDGDLDLAISARYDGRPTDFYWGNGNGTFELDAFHAGITTEDGWGMAAADFDHDGDLDLATYDTLFRNDITEGKGHWLQIRAVGNGTTTNRSAIGATVRVTAGGRTWIRHVQGNTGLGCQDSMFLHVGLGEATIVDQIVVSFPGGGEVNFPGPHAADQRLWLFQNGTTHAGWSPP